MMIKLLCRTSAASSEDARSGTLAGTATPAAGNGFAVADKAALEPASVPMNAAAA